MKMRYLNILLAASLMLPFTLVSAEEINTSNYLCSAEFSSGYDYKNGRWLRERYMPNDKYKIKPQEDDSWTVYAYQEDYEFDECSPVSDGILKCNIEADFMMNFETLKFSVTSTSSYVHSKRRNRDPVVLTLGTCVEI
jgi:hypothetical protein